MKISITQVSKVFGGFPAMDDVSLEIEPSQVVAVLGANGAGKTTLLRCLASVLAVDRGRIYYDGEEFNRGRLDLRRRLMFMPDFPMVFGEMTPVQHIGMLLRLYGANGAGLADRILDVFRNLDILHLVEAPLAKLSRGQVYKTALAGMLVLNPELWLLDEPFASGMDPAGIAYFRAQGRAAASAGRTVIYTTQILAVAEKFADRVVILDRGAVRVNEPIVQLLARATGSGDLLEEVFQQLRGEES